jgi:tetratricopeptide (TPR) repeat protein
LTTYRTADAIEILEPALAEFSDMDREPAFIALGGQLARAHFLADDNRGAIEVADRVLEAAEHADLVAIVADTLVTKGTALGIIGRVIEGLAVIGAGQAVAQAHDLSSTRLRAYINHSFMQASLDPRAALQEAQSGLAVARRLGRTSEATILLGNGVESAIRTGDWAWAMGELGPVLDEPLEASDRLTMLGSAVVIMALRGESTSGLLDEIQQLVGDKTEVSLLASLYAATAGTLFATGQLADARVTWHRVAQVSSGNAADSLPKGARAALWLRDIEAARADLALLDASGIHGPAVEADRATIRAGIAAVEGRPIEAASLYRGARRDWRNLGVVWDEALCGLDMVLLLDPADPDVREAAEASREILERLGARPFVDRLDAALGRAAPASATDRRGVPADVAATP